MPMAENPENKQRWYALRVTYGREMLVKGYLDGIGVESYTVGSAEFALSYAAMNPGKCIPLMDNGHYHPTEVVSDKIPALLTFFPEIALHITRPVRWDSDHVVLFDDETKELCKDDRPLRRLDAGVSGTGLLRCLCQPHRRVGHGLPQCAEGPAERPADAGYDG